MNCENRRPPEKYGRLVPSTTADRRQLKQLRHGHFLLLLLLLVIIIEFELMKIYCACRTNSLFSDRRVNLSVDGVHLTCNTVKWPSTNMQIALPVTWNVDNSSTCPAFITYAIAERVFFSCFPSFWCGSICCKRHNTNEKRFFTMKSFIVHDAPNTHIWIGFLGNYLCWTTAPELLAIIHSAWMDAKEREKIF